MEKKTDIPRDLPVLYPAKSRFDLLTQDEIEDTVERIVKNPGTRVSAFQSSI